MYAAQSAGSAPVVRALHAGISHPDPVRPNTIAKSIAIGNPADGFQVIETLHETGGWGEMVTDEEILAGIHLLAETEGIFTEPAGGTTVAVTRKLVEQGRIPRDESIVVCITGNGYKTSEVVADGIARPAAIGRSLRDFEAWLASRDADAARAQAVSA
jgi:threonine synthase